MSPEQGASSTAHTGDVVNFKPDLTIQLEPQTSAGIASNGPVGQPTITPKLEPDVKTEVKQESGAGEPKEELGPEAKPVTLPDTPIEKLQNGVNLEARAQSELTDETKDDVEDRPKVPDEKEVAQAKQRHEADLKHHHYEPPQAERIQDDWQVAYVWAFIVKFKLVERIRRLESIDDLYALLSFERCLSEPVADRPDDIFEGVLVRFLGNLKPGLRNLDCTNIQHHLSAFISDQLLNSNEFTVWDRPWAPNEDPRGPCCNQSAEREELGRLRYAGEPLSDRADKNPIKQVEERGGGLFELDWRERAKLLRQLVDWQLNHSEPIRTIINKEYKFGESRGSRKSAATEPEHELVSLSPLGQDRARSRIWALDYSGRLYKSGNPFKRPCPLFTIATSLAEVQAQYDDYKRYGDQILPDEKKSGKDKADKAKSNARKKLAKGIEDEKLLAQKIEELIPLIEKEEARVQRAKRRIAQATELAQQAEFRATRTRRSTKKINYSYSDGEEDDDEPTTNKRTRRDHEDYESIDHRGRPIIPGERRSTRNTGKEREPSSTIIKIPLTNGHRKDEEATSPTSVQIPTPTTAFGPPGSAVTVGSSANGTVQSAKSTGGTSRSGKSKKGMKGYAWVEEYVPFHNLSPTEQTAFLAAQNEGKEYEIGQNPSSPGTDQGHLNGAARESEDSLSSPPTEAPDPVGIDDGMEVDEDPPNLPNGHLQTAYPDQNIQEALMTEEKAA